MVATKRTLADMTILQIGDKLFIIFWHAKVLGFIVCGKEGVEKAVEFAHAYETDVADFHGPSRVIWTWVPQGMSVGRIPDSKLFSKDVVVSHWSMQRSGETPNARRSATDRERRHSPQTRLTCVAVQFAQNGTPASALRRRRFVTEVLKL